MTYKTSRMAQWTTQNTLGTIKNNFGTSRNTSKTIRKTWSTTRKRYFSEKKYSTLLNNIYKIKIIFSTRFSERLFLCNWFYKVKNVGNFVHFHFFPHSLDNFFLRYKRKIWIRSGWGCVLINEPLFKPALAAKLLVVEKNICIKLVGALVLFNFVLHK